MPYITLKSSPVYRQVTWEELLNGYVPPERFQPLRNAPSNTVTRYFSELNPHIVAKFDITGMVDELKNFNMRYRELIFGVPRESLYRHFEVPKKKIDKATGRPAMRPIDAPNDILACALRELKDILEIKCGALYHTNSFAYVKNRCAVDSIRRHQANESYWFLKTDFSNFFGNTTPEFTLRMMKQIFPFSEICKREGGEYALKTALSLCFLNGGLPQGTPISPMLTNIIMIPIDHRLTNVLKDYGGNHYIYTRYADDILISCKCKFDYQAIVIYINGVLKEFGAPFTIKDEKTRFGSRNGHNYNLGVCLNAENKITIGNKQKKEFRAMMNDFIRTYQGGNKWDLHDIQIMMGLLSYYTSIEKEYWERVISRLNEKYQCNFMDMASAELH